MLRKTQAVLVADPNDLGIQGETKLGMLLQNL